MNEKPQLTSNFSQRYIRKIIVKTKQNKYTHTHIYIKDNRYYSVAQNACMLYNKESIQGNLFIRFQLWEILYIYIIYIAKFAW